MKNPSGHGDGLLTACRVLDLSNERGFLCGKILGDFGADVIKVEPPGGDTARSIGPFYKDVEHPEKSPTSFGCAFQSKRDGEVTRLRQGFIMKHCVCS